ncbi:MAG: di-trans,poly-cis-decaprenylcistransferase [Candidatus Dependentiae bacterium]|nr:di-trans,poly-cis-decaprenylcistransferase [Candidatus Dependentiae bacterium]
MITHLACVMDGNRRWATRQGLLPWNGHRAGMKTVETAIAFCLQHQIPYLSLYTFSLENFKRSQQERSFLFDIVVQQAEAYLPKFIEQGIKIKFVGELQLFPESVQKICARVQDQTVNGTKLQVNLLFGYGARQEIFSVAKLLAQQMLAGIEITQELFESNLWTAGTPDPDLIIRTGGVQRLSNFLLYQSAYTEIRFLETLWPDLTEAEILNSVMSAVQAQKNVGK